MTSRSRSRLSPTGARPPLPERLLVEPLTGAETEEELVREQDRCRRRRVSHLDRVGAMQHRRHPGPDLERVGGVGDRPGRRPGVAGVALTAGPGLEVVRQHRGAEPDRLGDLGVADHLAAAFVAAVTDFVENTEPIHLDEPQWRAALTARSPSSQS